VAENHVKRKPTVATTKMIQNLKANSLQVVLPAIREMQTGRDVGLSKNLTTAK
jgi:metallophosphoesterase superfamily enzyme